MEGMWIHALLHWFNLEYWSPSWPNIFAPSVYTILGFIIADVRNARRHRQTRLHHEVTATGLAGQIDDLHVKLSAMTGDSNGNE